MYVSRQGDTVMTTTTTLQAKALYANSADTEEELSFAVGDVLNVHECDVAGLAGWWLCSHSGRIGIAPGNRLRLLTAATDAVVASGCRGDQQTATNTGKHEEPTEEPSSTTKVRPATASSQRGQTTQNNGVVKNKVSVTMRQETCRALIKLTRGQPTSSLVGLPHRTRP